MRQDGRSSGLPTPCAVVLLMRLDQLRMTGHAD
jgi:hypothetical protein